MNVLRRSTFGQSIDFLCLYPRQYCLRGWMCALGAGACNVRAQHCRAEPTLCQCDTGLCPEHSPTHIATQLSSHTPYHSGHTQKIVESEYCQDCYNWHQSEDAAVQCSWMKVRVTCDCCCAVATGEKFHFLSLVLVWRHRACHTQHYTGDQVGNQTLHTDIDMTSFSWTWGYLHL